MTERPWFWLDLKNSQARLSGHTLNLFPFGLVGDPGSKLLWLIDVNSKKPNCWFGPKSFSFKNSLYQGKREWGIRNGPWVRGYSQYKDILTSHVGISDSHCFVIHIEIGHQLSNSIAIKVTHGAVFCGSWRPFVEVYTTERTGSGFQAQKPSPAKWWTHF